MSRPSKTLTHSGWILLPCLDLSQPADLLKVIYKFRRRPSVRAEASEQGLDGM